MEPVERGSGVAAGRALVDAYASLDPRALGLFRVAFGGVLLADLLRRWPDIALFYSNEGVLSNHLNAFQPASRPMFSLLTAFSTPAEAKLAFAGFGLVFFAHMIGLYTRWTRVLVPVLCASLVARNPLVTNAGMSVMTLVAVWTGLLPVGERFSVDAVRGSLRAAPEPSLESITEPVRTTTKVVSVAALGVLLELAAFHGLNAAQQSGSSWRAGVAVHDVLWQDRLVTGVGAWLRAHEAPWLSPLLSTGTRMLEAAIAACLLSPFRRDACRALAVALIFVFHGAAALLLSLGALPWVLMASSLLLLPSAALDGCAVRLRALSAPTTLALDPVSPGEWLLVRTLRRLDSLSMLELVRGDSSLDPATLARATAALPFGRLLTPLAPLFSRGLTWFAARLAASSPRSVAPRPPSPLEEQARGTLAAARESFAAVFLLTALSQTSQENQAVPSALRFAVPERLASLPGYLGLGRAWNLFGPEAPARDGALVIDARTLDGRRVDPLSGRAPVDDPVRAGPARLGQLRCDYALRLSFDSNARYREELHRWLQGWRGGEGRLTDRLVSYEVTWVSWDTAPLGRPRPSVVDRRSLLSSSPRR